MLPVALLHRDFRLFITGLGLSSLGSQFTSVAMAWQIYQLTNSPLEIGLLGLVRAIPQMALIIFGGYLADTIDRRRLMMITQVGQFCVSASLVALSWSGLISATALYVASALLAVCSSLEAPARQAMVPNLVPREHLTSALALNGAQRNVGSIAGPSLAGLLLAFADPGWCYTVDALSWLAMLAALAAIRLPLAPSARRAMSLHEIGGGVGFVRQQPTLLGVLLLDFGTNIFGAPRALLPVYARDILQAGPEGLGFLYAATSAGAIGGAAVMSSLPNVRHAGVWLLAGIGLYGLSTALFAISTVYWLSWLMLAASGVGDTVAAVLRGTIVQLLTPDSLRGRVSSVNALFSNSGPQLGQFRGGAVAEAWGAPASALSGALLTLAMVALAAAIPRIRSFQLTEAPDAPQPAGAR